MQLSVLDRSGCLVATVGVAESPDALKPGDPEGAVFGTFERGTAFPIVAAALARFRAAYDSGDLEHAAALHEGIDSFGLKAVDSFGRRYVVFNVNFQEGGLLFCVAPETSPEDT